MAPPVVHGLEVVEIEEQHRHGTAVADGCVREAGQMRLRVAAVPEARQRVLVRGQQTIGNTRPASRVILGPAHQRAQAQRDLGRRVPEPCDVVRPKVQRTGRDVALGHAHEREEAGLRQGRPQLGKVVQIVRVPEDQHGDVRLLLSVPRATQAVGEERLKAGDQIGPAVAPRRHVELDAAGRGRPAGPGL